MIEETRRKQGQTVQPRTRRVATVAISRNPYADRPLHRVGEDLAVADVVAQ